MATPQLAPATPLAPPAPPLDDSQNVEKVTVTAARPKSSSPDSTFTAQGLADKYQQTEDKLAAVDEETGKLNPPKLDLPPPPQAQNTSPAEAWGSAAMALAAIGSLLTRQPLTTALNAGAAAMKAFKENDVQNAQLQFQQWKAATDMTVKQAQFQNEAYKTALSHASKDKSQALAELTAYGSAFGHTQMVELAKQRNQTAIEHLILDQEKHTDDLAKNAGKIEEGRQFTQAMNDPSFKAKLAAAPPNKRGQMVADLLQETAPDLAQSQGMLSDDAIELKAEQALSGDISDATGGMGYGKIAQYNKTRIANLMAQKAKEQHIDGSELAARVAEFQGLKAGERTLDTTAARIGLGSAEMQTLIPQVKQASAELKRTNYPSLNALIQAGQKETGDPALRNLAIRMQGLKSAYSQVLTRGGTPTDSVRTATEELFNSKDPSGVLDAALNAIQQEAAAIKKAPDIVHQELRNSLGSHNGSAPQQSAPQMPANYNAKSVSSQAEFDKLPHKTWYKEPDGQVYYKP